MGRRGRNIPARLLDFNLESAAFVLHSLAHDLENRQVFASRVFGSVYGFWLAFFQLTEPTPQTRGCLRHPSAPEVQEDRRARPLIHTESFT